MSKGAITKMIIYTIGFTRKTAEIFFESLKKNNVGILIDTRINNTSQLAGFAKGGDLPYFLKTICNSKYTYRPDFAPTKELLKDWQDKKINWQDYEDRYIQLIESRATYKNFLDDYREFDAVCLLCSEATTEHCHRRLLAQRLEEEFNGVEVIDL
jgi:uncharacterized protein YeaO (DUF488 family)